MSILTNLKKSLFEEDEAPPKSQPVKAAPLPVQPLSSFGGHPLSTNPALTSATPTTMPYMGMTTQAAITVDPQQLEGLRKTVTPKTGPLVMFMSTMNALAQYIQDELNRYRAVQANLEAQGVSMASVRSELSEVFNRVNNEIALFNTAKEATTLKEITGRETSLTGIDAQIADSQARITNLIKQRDAVATELAMAHAKIEETASKFDAAVRTVTAEYDEVMRRINLYIPSNGSNTEVKK